MDNLEATFAAHSRAIDTQTDEVYRSYDSTLFTTIGPISLAVWETPWSEPPYEPGDDLYITLSLTNEGTAVTAVDVSARATAHSDLVTDLVEPDFTFGDLVAGDSITSPQFYSLRIDGDYPAGTDLEVSLDIASEDRSFWSDTFAIPITDPLETSADGVGMPAAFALHEAHPNPFNPVTRLSYALPEAGEVSLIVYDAQGREVRVLRRGREPAGIRGVTWDGRDSRGRPVGSGVYIARLEAGRFQQSRKLVLLR